MLPISVRCGDVGKQEKMEMSDVQEGIKCESSPPSPSADDE